MLIDGVDCVRAVSDDERTRIRRMEIGFVYQYHHLLPEFSALENVMLPQMILGLTRSRAEARAKELLGSLGLAERWDHRPAQLSGGEQQRVAIARALANDPKVLLADEPTGNLDPPTAERVFELLLKLVRQSGLAAVMATHNLDLAARMDRCSAWLTASWSKKRSLWLRSLRDSFLAFGTKEEHNPKRGYRGYVGLRAFKGLGESERVNTH